jgi:hypothetical protein
MAETQLPRVAEAIIPVEKLRDYALSPEHPTGRHKARVFSSALGIGQDDWEWLRDQILAGIADSRVSAVFQDLWGFRYTVPILLEGLNGATHEVITAWIVEGDDAPPRLTSTHVNIP